MRSPKELKYEYENSVELINEYLRKFLNKKYNFTFQYVNIHGENRVRFVNLHLRECLYIGISIETFERKRTYRVELISGPLQYTLYCTRFETSIDSIKRKESEEYLPIFMYFRELKNINEVYNYINQNYIFLYNTPYFALLPLAYTFLLCNFYSRTFPKEIAKLIAHKILFASDASHPRCP